MTNIELLNLQVGYYVKWTGREDRDMLGQIVPGDSGRKAIKWADGTRVEIQASNDPCWLRYIKLSKKKPK